MSSKIALITIVLVCCKLHKADAVTWKSTCPIKIGEDVAKENLYLFEAADAPDDATGYTILTQNGNVRFSIASNGTLSSATKLDYESKEKVYSLKIMAFKDNGVPPNANLTCEIQVDDVNDERPQFSKESYSVTSPVNVAKDTILLNVSATDGDVTEAFRHVVYNIKEGGDKINFTITSDTGAIKAANNITGPQTLKITVVAKDNNNNVFTDETTVSICIVHCASGSSALEICISALMALLFGVTFI